MKRTHLTGLFLFFSLSYVLFLNTNIAHATPNELVDVRLIVDVLDVDLRTNLAQVKIHIFVPDYPANFSQLTVHIMGGGSVYIPCENTGIGKVDEWFYQGESNQTNWVLEGVGETYPFNSYSLRFKVSNMSLIGSNFTLIPEYVMAGFDGANFRILRNVWKTETDSILPKAEITSNQVIFSLQKTTNAFVADAIYSLVPIIACYYLLGGTLILNPRKDLGGRLGIYLSLFVFSSTFLLAIQPSLPFHSSITFPELMLSNLTISTAIFGIFSMVGSKPKEPWEFSEVTMLRGKWDLFGLTLALIIFLVLYFYTLFGKLNIESSIVFSYIIVPSYMYAFLLNIPRKEIMKYKIQWILFLIFFLFPLELMILLRIISILA